MELPLAYYGSPILRKKGEPVDEITEEICILIRDMIDTLRAKKGIGLAAPQVGKSLRIFITQIPIQQKDGSYVNSELRVFINPKIVKVSEEVDIFCEGCLSIPGVHADVVRPLRITIEATDLKGHRFQESFDHLAARCCLHENDHLNGVLFVDRVRGEERERLEPALKRIKNGLIPKIQGE